MAKEKIMLRVIKGGLIPADRYAESLLREKHYKVGEIVGAHITKLRNPRFHRLAHQLGTLCVENIETFENLDAHTALKRLQLEGKIACDEIGIMVHGYGMVIQFIPRSLSYSSMDETEFYDTMRAISHVISECYWPSMRPEKIEYMAGAMIDE